ncbi:MAG: hypothetical protein JXR13_04655 [Thalassovita sp.]
MTNQIALGLALFIAAIILGDIFMTGGGNLLFLGKKFADLIEWTAFWR